MGPDPGGLDWFYGPTADNPDPGRMWHRDCGGEVMFIEDRHVCMRCDRHDGPDPADLTARLREQLAEDERVALLAQRFHPTPWRLDPETQTTMEAGRWVADAADEGVLVANGDGPAKHFARHDPARVLAEVAAKRAILDRLLHDGGWELRHGVEHDQIETYYWSTCSCGWEQEVDRNSDIEWAHDKHREAVGYNESVADDVVRALAEPLRGVPGWRNEWATED